MGGNQNRGNNDPFAKAKFTMIPFAGTADPEAYLDWELAVEQKFNSHLVPAEHRVRLATSEFTSFALVTNMAPFMPFRVILVIE